MSEVTPEKPSAGTASTANGFPVAALSAAVTASIVGFGGTIAIILSATQAVNATPGQTASWITAICLAIAVSSGVLSWLFRMPIVAAYSTAGAALIGATTGVSIENAVGAFILAAMLLIITGLIKPLMDLVSRIPQSMAAAMLAGVLVAFPISASKNSVAEPLLLLPLVLVFLVARRLVPTLAAIITLGVGVAWAFGLGRLEPIERLGLAHFEWVTPSFDPTVMIGLGLPLYLVTMASQNLPGMAVLNTYGYFPPAGRLVSFTGLASLLTAPFGASTSNLSAITAAICIGPEAHPDKDKRWITGIFYSACYAIFALFGASITGLIGALPFALIIMIAGLALLSPLMGALAIALQDENKRFPAIVTFAVTASGVSVFGVGAAFWGLTAGIAALLIAKK
jgi:benzoate membrane transport protein